MLRAHGIKPTWTNGRLSDDAREHLRAINLTFHDLRHEAGSRWIEAGWPIHHAQQMLGHADLKQTSTYLNATVKGLEDSMRRFDEARGLLQSVAQTPAMEHRPDSHDETPTATPTVIN